MLHEAGAGLDLTLDQGRLLTPQYASPEQLKGETITVASDVYSLGVLLYELLTGKHPYATQRRSAAAIEEAILEGEPPLASEKASHKVVARQLRGELDAVLAKVLRRDPAERYGTADAFADDVERHLSGERVLAKADSLVYRMSKTLRRHRTAFTSAAAVVVALLALTSYAFVQAGRALKSAERERMVKEFVSDIFRVNTIGESAKLRTRRSPSDLLVENGARLIETRFPGQPELQAELFGIVGGVFADMGAYPLPSTTRRSSL